MTDVLDSESYLARARTLMIYRFITAGALVLVFLVILLALLWEPLVGPWSRERQGMANLRQAAQERQIAVEVARGELEAAQAQANAIRTMGEAARAYPEYRTQAFIAAFSEALAQGRVRKIVYIPVEAALPINEAGHR